MSELIPIALFGVVCAVLSHKTSDYDPIDGNYLRKERLWYMVMSIGLILFAGLRVWYNDTGTYRQSYDVFISADTDVIHGIDWLKIGENPAFTATQTLMKRWGVSAQSFIMIFSVFTIGGQLWFIRKYSCNIWLSILLFITFAGFTLNLAAIKQCTAMTLCLIGTDRVINKKYFRFVIYVMVASLFHPYALMYLAVPFLFFRPWSKYTLIMLAVFGAIGFGMEKLLGTVLDITDMLGESYNAASFAGEGVNPFRLLVIAVPSVLSLLAAEQIAETEEKDRFLVVNLTMLNAEIMFVGLFGTANYFGRLANYFIPFQTISIPWILKHYDYESRRTLTILAVVGYVLFFAYENMIAGSFDAMFVRTTLWKYLQSLFQGVF